MSEYNPIAIEKKWREKWESENRWHIDIKTAEHPYYNLMMFPYPSAEGLHIGNVYAFTGADIYGRYQRMRGNDVFEPMGFDAFGIHSENFALKKGVHPADLTEKNVSHFRDQLKKMGALFDWAYEVNTSKPEYYKWTQWLFLQLYKHGLAYRAKAAVDWCPGCKTVLADEQVIGGKCERCDSPVLQKDLEQWFFKITDYAERLLANLETIDWSESVKLMQKNWIGRSVGAEIAFPLLRSSQTHAEFTQRVAEEVPRESASSPRESATLTAVNVFTTRPDTLFGATYLVLAPEHELVAELKNIIENWSEVEAYIKATQEKSELERAETQKEKTGVELGGIKVINPATKEEIPVWIADYVLKNYGTGAIMAVPAHDQRDFEFAKAHHLPAVMVVCPNYPEQTCPVLDAAFEGDGHLVASGKFNGMVAQEAKDAIAEYVGGVKKVNYHLRDWLISRQRYWGPPIPIMYCGTCRNEQRTANNEQYIYGRDYTIIDGKEYAIVPVPEKDLPVLLPYVEDFHPTGTSESPLASVTEFVNTTCPTCGGAARRETDVSDTFLDSSWYFLRYPSVGQQEEGQTLRGGSDPPAQPWDSEITRKWLPVNMYIGGKEHSVLHLLYARFVTMALYDFGILDFEEPFAKFRAHGLLIKDGAKMSKSRGNVVNPDEYFASYGVDVTRMYLMFLAPFQDGGDWRDEGIRGISRFAKRVWELVQRTENSEQRTIWGQLHSNDNISRQSLEQKTDVAMPPGALLRPSTSLCDVDGRGGSDPPAADVEIERLRHKTIKRVTEDMERLQYNTAISALMEYTNQLTANSEQRTIKNIETIIILLAPFAPHLAEELWQKLGHEDSIHDQPWPSYDEAMLKEEVITLPVQINGKLRGTVSVPPGASEDEIKSAVFGEEKLSKFIGKENVAKWIIVPGRLVNVVLGKN